MEANAPGKPPLRSEGLDIVAAGCSLCRRASSGFVIRCGAAFQTLKLRLNGVYLRHRLSARAHPLWHAGQMRIFTVSPTGDRVLDRDPVPGRSCDMPNVLAGFAVEMHAVGGASGDDAMLASRDGRRSALRQGGDVRASEFSSTASSRLRSRRPPCI